MDGMHALGHGGGGGCIVSTRDGWRSRMPLTSAVCVGVGWQVEIGVGDLTECVWEFRVKRVSRGHSFPPPPQNTPSSNLFCSFLDACDSVSSEWIHILAILFRKKMNGS